MLDSTSTMLFCITFATPEGEDFLDVVDRITGGIVGMPFVDCAECVDDRPLEELRQQMRTLVTAHLQTVLYELDSGLPDLIDHAFKRGVTSMLRQEGS